MKYYSIQSCTIGFSDRHHFLHLRLARGGGEFDEVDVVFVGGDMTSKGEIIANGLDTPL